VLVGVSDAALEQSSLFGAKSNSLGSEFCFNDPKVLSKGKVNKFSLIKGLLNEENPIKTKSIDVNTYKQFFFPEFLIFINKV
jgi:hypothetical protein